MNKTTTAYVDDSILTWADLWPTRDLLVAARQQSTREWFQTVAPTLRLCLSERVLDAALAGDDQRLQRRFPLIADAEVLVEEPAVSQSAERWIDAGLCAAESRTTAYHLLIAATHGIELLVTWDGRFSQLAAACRDAPALTSGLAIPAVSSPEQMLHSIQP